MLPKREFKYFMIFNPNEHTTIFLSYDEPNCESNYKHLLTLNPNSLRVHGVKGSDTAHKEVAKLSKTQNVIVVDADNFVNYDFFSKRYDLPETYNPETNVLSFSALNTINGNCYGNGGIKVWPVSVLKNMNTHENGEGVDFDLGNYVELDIVASEIHFASKFQAWRAGFREGVKLLLDNGKPKKLEEIDYRNFDRLWMWSHVGMDVDYGMYAIYGCRQAMYWMLCSRFDYKQIIDFENLDDLYTGNTNDSNRFFSLMNIKTNNWFFGNVLSAEDSARYKLYHIAPRRVLGPLENNFQMWAHSFREATKNFNEQKTLELCMTGYELPFGTKRVAGTKAGLEYGSQYKHQTNELIKIFDYSWLREQYDKLYGNTL